MPKRPGAIETAVTRLEHILAIQGDGKAVVDGFDLERMRLADCDGRGVSGNVAALAIDDAEQAHLAGKRIGLDDIKVLRIGKAQHDAGGAGAAAVMRNEGQFDLGILRHRAVGDAERKPVRLRATARFHERFAVGQKALDANLPADGSAEPVQRRRAAVGARAFLDQRRSQNPAQHLARAEPAMPAISATDYQRGG